MERIKRVLGMAQSFFLKIKKWWDNYWEEYEAWFETLTPEEKAWYWYQMNRFNRFF